MSFLQPWMLWGLPVIALPIIIHLINQRRYQTIPWAAMMFLLAANRMSRGYARLRQWLILAMRVLAVAGLIFAVSRPLSSGWPWLAGGAETTLILLDRSPSMRQQEAGAALSKLEAGRQQLAAMLGLVGSSRWTLIDSVTKSPHDLESPEALLQLPEAGPVSASTDVPGLLAAAYESIQVNQVGSTDLWICSDLRQNDWDADSGRWKTLRDQFLALPQRVRFHLLAYPGSADNNLAVRVTSVRRRQVDNVAELLISLSVTRAVAAAEPVSAPLQFEIGGARSELTVELAGRTVEIQDHRIPLETSQVRGWGKVSLPADANPADDEFYFGFDEPVLRRTLIVGDNPSQERPLALAAGISPDPAYPATTETMPPDQLAAVEWDTVSLVLWHAALPTGEIAASLQSMLERGGQVIFFPPAIATSDEFLGVRWEEWHEFAEPISVESWRTDQDLLANTQSGASLPVGKLEISRACRLAGDITPLATLKDGSPLLARVATPRGGAYFCATTAAFSDSSLASEGVVLYVLVQRTLAAGAAGLGHVRELIAGEFPPEQAAEWQPIAIADGVLSTDYAIQAGVYAVGDKLMAVNRSLAEDDASVLAPDRVQELFAGLDFVRIDDRAGSRQALIEEMWKLFLLVMIVALLAESALCLPRKASGATPTVRVADFAELPTGVAP